MQSKFHETLDSVKTLVADDLQKMELLLTDKGNSSVSYITNIIQHLILSGGKRIRPTLLLAVSQMLGSQDERKVLVAAAIEFIHSATLLHDDVVDNSSLRRGVRTSNSLWGNKASILVGDFLFAAAFQWLVSCDSLPLLSVISEASSTIVTGEIQQMIYSNNLEITKEKYLEIISAKTATLFSATCESAAIIASVSSTQRHALWNFGYNFGIVFQILDDLLDYTSQQQNLGKPVGQDFLEGKATLPIIIAYESMDQEERESLKNSWKSGKWDPNTISSYITSYNVIQRSTSFAMKYVTAAEEALEVFPDSPYKSNLHTLLQSAVLRQS